MESVVLWITRVWWRHIQDPIQDSLDDFTHANTERVVAFRRAYPL